MDTAQLLIDVLGPVVLIVAAGALAGPRLGLDTETLSKLAYWILGPAFIFDIFSTTSLPADTAIKLVAAGAAGLVAAGLVAKVLAPAAGLRGPAASATVMSSAFGNVGNAGLAISVFALGDDALDRAGVLMLTILFLGTLLSVGLGTRQRESSLRAAARAVASPMIAAGIVGFIVNVFDLALPLLVERSASTFAQGLIPVMLFTLGLQLATTGNLRFMRSTAVVGLAKLAVAPLVGWAIAEVLGLTGDDRGVIILQSAMPPAVFCMVMAIEHDLEAERTTNDVVVVTVLSLITLPVVLTLLS